MRNGQFVADAHAHLFPEPTIHRGRAVHFPASALVEQMDRHGVDLALVIARPTEPLDAMELARHHDDLAEAVDGHGERFRLAAWAAPRHGWQAVAELERCLGEEIYAAVKLHPEQEAFAIDDRSVDPLVRAAEAYGVPVFAHTALGARGAEPWRLARLARRHPEVTFVMCHLGADGNLLQTLGAVEIAATVPNIVVESSSTVTDPYATYLGPAERLGPDRVMVGSNEPLHQVALSLLKLDLLPMPDEWRARITGGNLARLLRLPGPSRQSSAFDGGMHA